jgi:hypothetical protein
VTGRARKGRDEAIAARSDTHARVERRGHGQTLLDRARRPRRCTGARGGPGSDIQLPIRRGELAVGSARGASASPIAGREFAPDRLTARPCP